MQEINSTYKTIHFISGLPRSGSTVISSILNQNPEVYVTPTSPMLNITVKMQESWVNDPTVIANYSNLEPQINNLTKAILPAFWQHRKEPIIFDKGRGWAKNMPTVNKLFEKKIKVLLITRDLPSIMASWLTLIKAQTKECKVITEVKRKGFEPTDENLMAEMWFNMVKDCMEGTYQIKKEVPDQILEVTYDNFIMNPREELNKIQTFFDLPSYNYDLLNIQNDTVDDDLSAWGIENLHKIRSTLAKTSKCPKDILGKELYNRFVDLEKQYV